METNKKCILGLMTCIWRYSRDYVLSVDSFYLWLALVSLLWHGLDQHSAPTNLHTLRIGIVPAGLDTRPIGPFTERPVGRVGH